MMNFHYDNRNQFDTSLDNETISSYNKSKLQLSTKFWHWKVWFDDNSTKCGRPK